MLKGIRLRAQELRGCELNGRLEKLKCRFVEWLADSPVRNNVAGKLNGLVRIILCGYLWDLRGPLKKICAKTKK